MVLFSTAYGDTCNFWIEDRKRGSLGPILTLCCRVVLSVAENHL